MRISGAGAIQIAEKIFRTASGKALSQILANNSLYGDIIKDNKRIDDGMCTVFRAPRSFTGEDTVEISCHGGIVLTEMVLEAAFEAGARQAEAGEFTKRAFINGKISLSQAEAVGMLIDAESEEMLSVAASHENGVLKNKADELYERLKTIVIGVYANVDFPDEDLAELSDNEVISELLVIETELKRLKSSYKVGRAVCEGIKTVIVGKPNTGKSSLLNCLVGRERAIVTDIAGTTRDTIEETVKCGRILLRLCDTAGIRETEDRVERIGVERSVEKLKEAELILAVFDSSRELDEEDFALIKKLEETHVSTIALLNKSDLPAKIGREELSKYGIFNSIIEISARKGEAFNSSVDNLKDIICSMYIEGEIDYQKEAIIANARQNASVTRALEYIRSAKASLESGLTSDTAGLDLEAALTELSELDGRRVTEQIVDGIFHRFCVGK